MPEFQSMVNVCNLAGKSRRCSASLQSYLRKTDLDPTTHELDQAVAMVVTARRYNSPEDWLLVLAEQNSSTRKQQGLKVWSARKSSLSGPTKQSQKNFAPTSQKSSAQLAKP